MDNERQKHLNGLLLNLIIIEYENTFLLVSIRDF